MNALVEIGGFLAEGLGKSIGLLFEPGKPFHKFKKEIYEAIDLFSFTERWNWTPNQIRKLTEEDKMIYKALLSGVVGVEQSNARKNK